MKLQILLLIINSRNIAIKKERNKFISGTGTNLLVGYSIKKTKIEKTETSILTLPFRSSQSK